MGKKVFVSYKYADNKVRPVDRGSLLANLTPTTARDYVNILQSAITDGVHTYKGEEDGNDLSEFSDDTIETELKRKIQDSSVTIVLVSKGMKGYEDEADQWIPWEISYSLKEIAAADRTSRPNGLLAVILPDENGSYSYYLDECSHCDTRTHKTNTLFEVLRNNMFNLKNSETYASTCFMQHGQVYSGMDHSYAYQVKWDDFMADHELYIDHAATLRDNIENYDIQKVIKKSATPISAF